MTRARGRPAGGLVRARVRITAITVACLTFVLVIGAFAIVTAYRQDLTGQLDGRLRQAVNGVGGLDPAATASVGAPVVDVNVQAIDGEGTVVFSGTPLAGAPALWQPGEPTGPRTVRIDRGAYRTIATPFGALWIVLAEPLAPVDGDVRTLSRSMMVALPALLIAVGIVIWFSVGWTLRPVARAMERERRFVTDASHELRSPIAAVRLLVETDPDDPEERRQSRRRALLGLDRLTSITDQLIELGRVEAGTQPTEHPVDLDELVHRAVDRLQGTHERDIDVSRVVAAQVHGSEAHLESLVDNLLANAVRHARRQVVVEVAEHGGRAVLVIDDDGSGIPAVDRGRVFERFTRLDASRSRASGGSGLGLSIVKATAEAHGGSVSLDEAPLGGCRVVVSLPATTAP